MNTNAINAAAPIRASESNSPSKMGANPDKNAFLQLLATQLQYQDPLKPMENSEFVAQLAQFSSLEQLMQIRESLGRLETIGSTNTAGGNDALMAEGAQNAARKMRF